MFGLKKDPKKEFWRWLVSHRREIHGELNHPAAPQSHHWSVNQLGRQLKAVVPGLVHEIGMADPSTIELIISADGIRDKFPSVIALVKEAPRLSGYKITAFRPRCGHGTTLEVAGRTISNEILTYKIISEDEELGIELFIDCQLDHEERCLVGFLSLDQRLGEYDVATGLKWIEFAVGRPTEALPIARLAEDFDNRRGLLAH